MATLDKTEDTRGQKWGLNISGTCWQFLEMMNNKVLRCFRKLSGLCLAIWLWNIVLGFSGCTGHFKTFENCSNIQYGRISKGFSRGLGKLKEELLETQRSHLWRLPANVEGARLGCRKTKVGWKSKVGSQKQKERFRKINNNQFMSHDR